MYLHSVLNLSPVERVKKCRLSNTNKNQNCAEIALGKNTILLGFGYSTLTFMSKRAPREVYIPRFAELATALMEAMKRKYQHAPTDPTEKKTDTNVPKKRTRIKLAAKEARIDWSDVMVKNCTALKQALVDATGLCLPKPRQSHCAVGSALEQLQEDGEYHPVAFFSRKVQAQRAGTGAGKRDTGQYAWTPREKETYAVVACLLKF